MTDWTEKYSQKEMAGKAKNMVDGIILDIHQKHLPIYKGLSRDELALLFRFPIYVGVNLFVERMLRVACQNEGESTQTKPKTSHKSPYFRDTDASVVSYYYDYCINYKLLNELSKIIHGGVPDGFKNVQGLPKPQEVLLCVKPLGLKAKLRKIRKFISQSCIKAMKPAVVGENSNWMRESLPAKCIMDFDFKGKVADEDQNIRLKIRESCEKVFVDHAGEILGTFNGKQISELAKTFADYIDHIMPVSIVEGFQEKLCYYSSILKNWNIKQVHSSVGYYYNENFKVFALLARRKKALLISHAHGISNGTISYKHICNELAFLDYYFAWGNGDSSWMKGDEDLNNLKILGMGSPYLSTMQKWKKGRINSNEIVLFYLSGPLMDFMSDIEEPSPEKNRQHRLRVLELLKKLRALYPALKVLYKPFPGTYTNDPIREVFAEEIDRGVVQHITQKPSSLYAKVDIVLWDSISTGFAESIQSGVPTVVFHSRTEFDAASRQVKKLNQGLEKCGVIFYDVNDGLRSFRCVINDLQSFTASAKGPVRDFQEAMAYPVSRKVFWRGLSSALAGAGEKNNRWLKKAEKK